MDTTGVDAESQITVSLRLVRLSGEGEFNAFELTAQRQCLGSLGQLLVRPLLKLRPDNGQGAPHQSGIPPTAFEELSYLAEESHCPNKVPSKRRADADDNQEAAIVDAAQVQRERRCILPHPHPNPAADQGTQPRPDH